MLRTVGSDGRDTSMSDKRRTISQTEREKTRAVMALCRATADLELSSHHIWLGALPESSAPVRREAVGGTGGRVGGDRGMRSVNHGME